jgi:hypothetical protein
VIPHACDQTSVAISRGQMQDEAKFESDDTEEGHQKLILKLFSKVIFESSPARRHVAIQFEDCSDQNDFTDPALSDPRLCITSFSTSSS